MKHVTLITILLFAFAYGINTEQEILALGSLIGCVFTVLMIPDDQIGLGKK